ncbi:MAG: CBS domain-containing protein [Streptosporangiaceae bacterium]|nr:CBS domain-containing protein [Streptosporangiaceae bacterium]MBV9854116.1 CBS domain-containing protein [Streptosporangiaceae bacterium]
MGTKVRDVMTPDPIGVYYDQTIGEAAQVMRDAGVGAVLVVNGQELCGVVTDRDLVVRAVAESMGPDHAVGPLASPDLVGVHADDDTSEAVRLMRRHAIRRLPVIDEGQVAGMVSLGDIAIARDSGSALADVCRAKPNT